jgi:hypothetical protein
MGVSEFKLVRMADDGVFGEILQARGGQQFGTNRSEVWSPTDDETSQITRYAGEGKSWRWISDKMGVSESHPRKKSWRGCFWHGGTAPS